jgi:NTE family protein
MGISDFDELNIKLFIAATDLIKGESVIFSEGNLFDAVIASASIPVVFEPFKYGDKLFVDGGILNNFPIEPLVNICDVIIGSFVNKVEDGIYKNSFFKTLDIVDRCLHLAIASSVYSKVNKCDIFIEIPLHNFDTYSVKQAEKLFEIGYNSVIPFKEKIQELTMNFVEAD